MPLEEIDLQRGTEKQHECTVLVPKRSTTKSNSVHASDKAETKSVHRLQFRIVRIECCLDHGQAHTHQHRESDVVQRALHTTQRTHVTLQGATRHWSSRSEP